MPASSWEAVWRLPAIIQGKLARRMSSVPTWMWHSLRAIRPGTAGHPFGSLKPFNPKFVLCQKSLALQPGEDSRGRADGPDTARAESTRHAQAVFGSEVVQQSVNITRVECIAAATA